MKAQVRFLSAVTDENHQLIWRLTILTDLGSGVRRELRCQRREDGQGSDLLTTPSTPRHAMKGADTAKAQGAIFGKEMTGLKSGKRVALALVTLP